MRKPKIITPCVADRYASPWERIIEFSGQPGPDGSLPGGLISIRTGPDGDLIVQVYRTERTTVTTPTTERTP